MKLPDAIATHNATAMPAPPIDLNPRDLAAFGDRDVAQQRGPRERRAPEDLRRRVQRELALEDACRRPRDRRECHIDLPPPPTPRLLTHHRRRRHAAKS